MLSSGLQRAKLTSLQKLNDKLRTRFFEKNGTHTGPIVASVGWHHMIPSKVDIVLRVISVLATYVRK